jgi:hypothetical protein
MKSKKYQRNQSNHNSNYNYNNKDVANTKGERVSVYVRIRPFNEDELEKDSSTPLEVVDTKNNALICNYNNIFKLIILLKNII